MAERRLLGQEISVRVIQGGNLVDQIDAVGSFNDNTDLEIKQDGFLGESADRFDQVLHGHSGDFEFQPTNAGWHRLKQAIIDKATRRVPDLVFNVVVAELYANSDNAVITYPDVSWGPIPKNVSSRTDFVKVKLEFKSTDAPVDINALP